MRKSSRKKKKRIWEISERSDGIWTQTLDEHQRILGQHFDLKKLYDEELENYSNMTLVQRFPFRSDVYDKILKDASLLKNADKIFAPLI